MIKSEVAYVEPIEEWWPEQILDKEFRKAHYRAASDIQGVVRIHFADRTRDVDIRQAIFNLPFFQIAAAFGLPIEDKYFIPRKPMNNGALFNYLNTYYFAIMNQNSIANSEKLKQVTWDAINEAYSFLSTHISDYYVTIDMLELTNVMNSPTIKEIVATKWNIKPEWGSDVIEKYVDVQSARIREALNDGKLINSEALAIFSRVGQLNPHQTPQVMYAYSVRTDVSDAIVRKPIIGSGIDGLLDTVEFVVEGLSAKKSAFYNRNGVADSQFAGRKQHLLCSSLQHIYPGDCGSTNYVRLKVTDKNFKNLAGKIAILDGKQVVLDNNIVGTLVGTTIAMRSPMTCRYRNGVCTACGGSIFAHLHMNINIGILSAVHVIEPTTQMILSAKHLIKTLSIVYNLPTTAIPYFLRTDSGRIKWRPNMYDKISHMELGIPLKSFKGSIHDVTYLSPKKLLKDEVFSSVPTCMLRSTGETDHVENLVLEQNKQAPFLALDFLIHMKKVYDQISMEDGVIWIPLKGTNKIDIFGTNIINDNMLMFVNSVTSFLSSPIRNYTSCSDALQAFSDLIYSKVSANIVHIETVLKAYLVTSSLDYRIPLVENPDDVHFQTTSQILGHRHVGTKLGYQGLAQYLAQPSTYLVARQSNPFDMMTVGR